MHRLALGANWGTPGTWPLACATSPSAWGIVCSAARPPPAVVVIKLRRFKRQHSSMGCMTSLSVEDFVQVQDRARDHDPRRRVGGGNTARGKAADGLGGACRIARVRCFLVGKKARQLCDLGVGRRAR